MNNFLFFLVGLQTLTSRAQATFWCFPWLFGGSSSSSTPSETQGTCTGCCAVVTQSFTYKIKLIIPKTVVATWTVSAPTDASGNYVNPFTATLSTVLPNGATSVISTVIDVSSCAGNGGTSPPEITSVPAQTVPVTVPVTVPTTDTVTVTQPGSTVVQPGTTVIETAQATVTVATTIPVTIPGTCTPLTVTLPGSRFTETVTQQETCNPTTVTQQRSCTPSTISSAVTVTEPCSSATVTTTVTTTRSKFMHST